MQRRNGFYETKFEFYSLSYVEEPMKNDLLEIISNK